MSSPNKYYLYRHIRPDKKEVFYIGVGQKVSNYKTYEKEFRRAFEIKWNRNKYWRNIVNKNPDYIVEIIIESNDYDFILQKEIEFIKLYGRKDLGLGTLVNMNDGGGGQKGKKFSEEIKKKLSEIRKKAYKEGKLSTCFKDKKIYQYDIDGNFIKEWKSAKEVGEFYNIDKSCIQKCASGKHRTSIGFKWFYKTDNDNDEQPK